MVRAGDRTRALPVGDRSAEARRGEPVDTGRMIVRLLAAGFVLLTVYYLWFFVAVRQDPATLVQVALLLLAAALLVRLLGPSRRLSTVRISATALFSMVLIVAVLAWADRDSHSASDTLSRAVPALCLVLAVAVRLASGSFYNPRGVHS
jgi:hypothetical protein